VPAPAFGLLVAALLCMLWGCSGSSAPAGGGGAGGGGQGGGGFGGGGGRRGGGGPTVVVAHKVEAITLSDETEALGTAKSNEAVDITAKSTNRVVALHLREGEFVKKGAVLVEFDGTEARANLAAAEALARDTQSQYERGKRLFQIKALSESDIVQLEAKMLNSRSAVEAAQARVNDTVISAPFGGRIGLRNTSVGSLVTPGQVITTLDDIDVIKLDFAVPETFLTAIKNGEFLDARSSAYPDEVFRGRVDSIATRVDPVSRSVVVRALLDNRQHRLKPGMFMTVRLKQAATRTVVVPEQALMPENDAQFVYVLNGDVAHKVALQLGRRRPGQVEVLKGLGAGDVVVVEGGEKLREGAKVQARLVDTVPSVQ
jgi:membrane fusion protein (multidrug efflux system)